MLHNLNFREVFLLDLTAITLIEEMYPVQKLLYQELV